jgi:hypothetical protein
MFKRARRKVNTVSSEDSLKSTIELIGVSDIVKLSPRIIGNIEEIASLCQNPEALVNIHSND